MTLDLHRSCGRKCGPEPNAERDSALLFFFSVGKHENAF